MGLLNIIFALLLVIGIILVVYEISKSIKYKNDLRLLIRRIRLMLEIDEQRIKENKKIKEKISAIYDHFGQSAQLEKLIEEANEVKEAVEENDREHIIEEIADLRVVLVQLQNHFGITEKEINCVRKSKIDRTISRIKEKYYEEETK